MSQLRSLATEFATVRWLFQEVSRRRAVPVAEAAATIHALHGVLHASDRLILPFLRSREAGDHLVTRTLNVTALAMGYAEGLGHPADIVRTIGLCALLRDIGKALLPPEWFDGRPLDDEQRDRLRRHPVDGARLLLESEARLDLAAVVAYEHHVRPDGGGYPDLRYPREPHDASRLVQVCDVYDSLSTPRGNRRPWPYEKVLEYLNDRAGIEFDRHFAKQLIVFMKEYDKRVLVVRDLESPLPLD